MRPQDQQLAVANAYKGGTGPREISESLGIPLGTVRKWITALGRAGVIDVRGRGGRTIGRSDARPRKPRRPEPRPTFTDFERTIAKEYDEGSSLSQIGRRHNMTKSAVSTRLTRLRRLGLVKTNRGTHGLGTGVTQRNPDDEPRGPWVPAYAKPMLRRWEDIGPRGRDVL